MYGYGYSLYNRLAFLGGLDPDATAFFSATGITDPTIQGAINSLCVDLKTYGVWSKMKAIYPFVGGTATTHKFNLKDSRDLDDAFRLSFSGGITHDVNGLTPNGVNGFANTFLTPSTSLTLNSTHISIYSRVNIANTGSDIGSSNINFANGLYISPRFTDNRSYTRINGASIEYSSANSLGYFVGTRTSSTLSKLFLNNTLKTSGGLSTGLNDFSVNIGALNNGGVRTFSNRQLAFSTIGDGLTDEDSANLYYSVQKFQTTLGRQVGTPIYSSNATDVNARLFLGATNIQDATITSAVDTLVQGLKTDGVWSKLKAVYPFVGGTATTHKFNLANALDEGSAFRMDFTGGWTHSANGALPNGVNAYGDMSFIAAAHLGLNSAHVSVYSRTNTDKLAPSIANATGGQINEISMFIRDADNLAFRVNNTSVSLLSNTNSTGYYIANRNSSTEISIFKNNTKNSFSRNSGSLRGNSFQIGAFGSFYDNKQYAFVSIGDGLTDTEASNLNTRVQAFQTTLNRQV
jgi:hypothetical protein